MQARWTRTAPGQAPPTIVLVHGILGRRQNLNAFARMLAQVSGRRQTLVCAGREESPLFDRFNGFAVTGLPGLPGPAGGFAVPWRECMASKQA